MDLDHTMTASTLRSSTLTALAFAITLALATTSTSAQAADLTNGMATVAHATQLSQGDIVSGRLSNMQPMHIAVGLKLRNRDKLDSLIAARQILAPGQFEAQNAPTQAQAQAVAEYLARTGFKNVVISTNRLLVSADGTAGSARAAFLTSFARVQTKEGRIAFANNSDAYIPASLQGSVLSVMGLQTVHQAHTTALRAQRVHPNAGTEAGEVGFDPVDFPSIYNGTSLPTAAGVTVGIIAVGEQSQTIADLNTFTDSNSLARVTTQTVFTPASNTTTPNQGLDEFDLDSQDIVGMGGGQVGKIIFYSDPDFTYVSMIASINTVMTANVAKIINMSIGGCEIDPEESGEAAVGDQIFQVAAAQGQTFSISTGDSGAYECGAGTPGAEWPASSPYVVALGGTTLDASTTTWASEIVWNWHPGVEGVFGAPGGSPSVFEPKPSWQNLGPAATREVADVSFDADPNTGALLTVDGSCCVLYGGTSLAAPLFSGFWARVIAGRGTAVGFAAPQLYALPATDFHDVTVGNNGGYKALVGYDYPTGRGTLIMDSAYKHIDSGAGPPPPPPLIANFSYTTSGLIAKFTDTSTDTAGKIKTHAWTFGDGGTSTIANPSHFYLKAGTYAVAEYVVDNKGLSASKISMVKVVR
jgi:pseudomonalisin